jgi:hypothetical protein
MLRYKILWWRFKDLFTKRSKFRRLERRQDYLEKKLEAWIGTVENLK